MKGTEKQIAYAKTLIEKYQNKVNKLDLDKDLAYALCTILIDFDIETCEKVDNFIKKVGTEKAKEIVKKFIDLGFEYLNQEEKSWNIINLLKYQTGAFIESVSDKKINQEMRKIRKEIEELL